jgi:hypothetical protein
MGISCCADRPSSEQKIKGVFGILDLEEDDAYDKLVSVFKKNELQIVTLEASESKLRLK